MKKGINWTLFNYARLRKPYGKMVGFGVMCDGLVFSGSVDSGCHELSENVWS